MSTTAVTKRRSFIKGLFFGLLIPAMAGCPMFSSIETDIENYGPILLQAADGILALFNPALAAALQTVITLIQAGIADVIKAVADWKIADAAQKPGFLGDVLAALQVAQQDFATFLASVKLNASAPIYAVVLALVKIVQGVLQFFVNQVTSAIPASVKVQARPAVLIEGGTIVPLKYSSKQFIAAFNAQATSLGHPEACIGYKK
jgi:hypothetical protein